MHWMVSFLLCDFDATISSQNGMCPTHYLAVLLTIPESRGGSWYASDKLRRISEWPVELRYNFTVVIRSTFVSFIVPRM